MNWTRDCFNKWTLTMVSVDKSPVQWPINLIECQCLFRSSSNLAVTLQNWIIIASELIQGSIFPQWKPVVEIFVERINAVPVLTDCAACMGLGCLTASQFQHNFSTDDKCRFILYYCQIGKITGSMQSMPTDQFEKLKLIFYFSEAA